jgi:two-component system phosphate regulon sensor histidine kinase PhoR
MFALSAAAVAVVAVSFLLLERYWIDHYGAEALREPEYIFYVVIILALALTAAVLLSLLLANSIVRPLERSEDDYVELSHLKRRLDAQSSLLQNSSDELEEKERNLSLVVANMQEGLILLDRKGIIMSMNNSACSMLGAEPGEFLGKHIMAANNAMPLQAAVNEALGGKSARDFLELGESTVELSVNPVAVEKVIRGAVVFLRDVTEYQAAEKMRREFSANVSHELKTPLTSISGYAELMKEGMAKAEDAGWFASKIYDEAQRLISLTDDIMRLSRLDEGGTALPVEELELMPVVLSVSERLAAKAEEHGVSLSVSGGGGRILGNAGLLDEMVYNLCDNAIKYNRPHGSVTMSVREMGNSVMLTVADTGVGIPREHQNRVFERFYRVDKSHSKATGGTGLGLSIVKNGAAFHKARLELDSKAGVGTTIRLSFAKV